MNEAVNKLAELFNEVEPAENIAKDLVQLVFNYASVVDENTLPLFKKDIQTIELLYNALND